MPYVSGYMRLVLTLSMTLALCGQATAEVIATKTYTYFDIRGRTAGQLDEELSRRGPTASGSSSRHPGATKIRFSGEATYVHRNGRCQLASAKVVVHTQIILPRWRNRRGASQELSVVWDALSSDIKRHEERHAEIARTQARTMERRIRSLPSQRTCEAMQEMVAEESSRGIEVHDRLQAQFDRVEAVNFEIRMMRLLSNRINLSQRKN
jgi:predicted secreted Zn-dependent protease